MFLFISLGDPTIIGMCPAVEPIPRPADVEVMDRLSIGDEDDDAIDVNDSRILDADDNAPQDQSFNPVCDMGFQTATMLARDHPSEPSSIDEQEEEEEEEDSDQESEQSESSVDDPLQPSAGPRHVPTPAPKGPVRAPKHPAPVLMPSVPVKKAKMMSPPKARVTRSQATVPAAQPSPVKRSQKEVPKPRGRGKRM